MNDGLHHDCAFGGTARLVRHRAKRERPRPIERHVEPRVRTRLRDDRGLGADGVADDHVGACGFGLVHLLRECLHAQVEARRVHGLQVLGSEKTFDILEAAFAVAGLVGKECHPRVAALDDVVHQMAGLQRVARGQAKDVARGGRVFRGDGRACGHRHHQKMLVVLEYVERFHCHAGVAKPDGEVDLLLGHELFGDLAALVRVRLVVALDQFDGPAQETADLVDFLDCQLRAQAGAVAEVLRAAGERANEPHSHGLGGSGGLGLRAAHQTHRNRGCGRPREDLSHLVSSRRLSWSATIDGMCELRKGTVTCVGLRGPRAYVSPASGCCIRSPGATRGCAFAQTPIPGCTRAANSVHTSQRRTPRPP